MSLRTRRIAPRLAALVTAAAVLAPAPAFASPVSTRPSQPPRSSSANPSSPPTTRTDPRLEGLRASSIAAIDKRLATLEQLGSAVEGAKFLTDENQSALEEKLESATSGLTSLKEKIAADTDMATLKVDAAAVVKDYRVYLLVVPQVNLTIAGDTLLAGAAALRTAIGVVKDALAAREHDPSLDALVADAEKRVASAEQAAGGIAGTVLPLVARDYPQNRPQLEAARRSAGSAHKDLRAARDALHKVVAALRTA